MRFAGRPGFVSMPEMKESVGSTPDTSASWSPPDQAHPLLFEYMQKFQTTDGQLNGGPASATFPPEQSMLPAFMPGSDVLSGLKDKYTQNTQSPVIVENPVSPFGPSKMEGQISYTTDWETMLPSESQSMFGSNMSLPPDFAPLSSNEEQYLLGNDAMSQNNGTLPNYIWDDFLSGLLPKDAQSPTAV